MKIDSVSFDTENLTRKPPRGILLYGSDEGLIDYLVWEVREHLRRQGEALTHVEEASFIENPHMYLMPDLFSQSENRFILLEEVSDKQSKFYQELITNLQSGMLLLTSLKLRAASSMVRWALQHPQFWAVSCYPLEGNLKSALFQKGAKRFNLNLPPAILKNFLPSLSVAEMPQLFQKLSLYEKGPITLEALEACWGHTLTDHTDLAYALSGRDASALNRWLAQPNPDVLLGLRQALRHFAQMLSVQSALSQKESLEVALTQLSPPVFFKQLPLFKAHVSQWSLPTLGRAMSLLVHAEIAFKKGSLTHGYTPLLRAVITH